MISPDRTKSTPALMLQGTSSNAGKSVLTAAMCRILLQDGFSVAPFKAQNMALNSFVTPDGCEIGRAQAVQAVACRMEPDTRMNPVLLKPSSDTGSQVILLGKAIGTMRVKEYVKYKPKAFEVATGAYDSLAAEHDIMVLEGAGSPAEINLKAHDIVNMQMARHANAKVLLVGDIDRGGVFASLVGTMELLDQWEKDLVAGFVLNRFRGDASLLDSALEYTTGRTGKPFYGVVPYLHNLGLPEEDSVSFKEDMGKLLGSSDATREDALDVALIDLPHIANFTDLDALRVEPDVALRAVRSADQLGVPDVIVIPGSKNTPGDMKWLTEAGLADAIVKLVNARETTTSVIGICGGFQMLGRSVDDPHCVEFSGGSIPALGLLPVHTCLAEHKVLTRVTGVHVQSGCAVEGYEIHHGQTTVADGETLEPAIRLQDGSIIGYAVAGASESGRACPQVWGTYLHGLFDADAFRRSLLDSLRITKGLKPIGTVVAPFTLDPALDRLAATVRDAIDMDMVYKALGL